MGYAVEEENITELFRQYSQAGLGGVNVTPIYGVKGYEDRFNDYLSPGWMNELQHTFEAGSESGLGVDMSTGTG